MSDFVDVSVGMPRKRPTYFVLLRVISWIVFSYADSKRSTN